MDIIKTFLNYSSKKFKLIIINDEDRITYIYYIKINKNYKAYMAEHDYDKKDINLLKIYKNLDYGINLYKLK